jgi:pyruvate,water dikinase
LSYLVKEASKRLRVPQELVYCTTCEELAAALRGESKAPKKQELEDRRKECVLYTRGERVLVATEKNEVKKLVGEISEEKARHDEVKKITGTCACPGHAFGAVRIVNKAEEMSKMQRGDVLVSQMTNPEIVIAMKKASAIVTDFGGLTCHAAIVSRELGIPCVVGTRVATRVLRDGDRVAVNATLGEVTKA